MNRLGRFVVQHQHPVFAALLMQIHVEVGAALVEILDQGRANGCHTASGVEHQGNDRFVPERFQPVGGVHLIGADTRQKLTGFRRRHARRLALSPAVARAFDACGRIEGKHPSGGQVVEPGSQRRKLGLDGRRGNLLAPVADVLGDMNRLNVAQAGCAPVANPAAELGDGVPILGTGLEVGQGDVEALAGAPDGFGGVAAEHCGKIRSGSSVERGVPERGTRS